MSGSGANRDDDDWNPDEGSDSDDWNPDEGNSDGSDDWNQDCGSESDDWDPDGGNESRSDDIGSDIPDNHDNDDSGDADGGGGFWDNYFESTSGIKNEENNADDESENDTVNDEKKDVTHESNNFFVKEENYNTDEWEVTKNNDDDIEAFYNEATKRKQPLSPQSHHSSQISLSQQSHVSSQYNNISAAELSRLEEDLLSETSHHEEEMKRQSEKIKRRESRRRGESRKRPRKALTEEQKQYKDAYHRIKYDKVLDLSEEFDVGCSFAYLAKKKLEEDKEQKRLKGLALERERLRRTEMKTKNEESEMIISSKRESRSWTTEGYAAIPSCQAKEFPFFVYCKRQKSCINSRSESDSDGSLGSGDDSNESETRTKKLKHQLMIEENGVELENLTVVRKYKQIRTKRRKLGLTFGSFPLHQYRSKPKLGISLGSEQMVWSQGRNAKRLWARMVASNGVDIGDISQSQKDFKNENDKDKTVDESSSLLASTGACQANGEYKDGTVTKQLLRLTRQIHDLPKTTHRQHFMSSVANELGRNRYLWEKTLRKWVEKNDFFTKKRQVAIKTFLGVDGDITSGSKCSFDVFNTHPTKLVGATRKLRYQLLARFRRWVQKKQTVQRFKSEVAAMDEIENFYPTADRAGGGFNDVDIISSSSIDNCNIAVTLSYFLDQLCLVKKRCDHLRQMNSIDSRGIRLATQDIRKWHQLICSYLSMAKKESKSKIAAFIKTNNIQYQLPLFKAIVAQHSYVANGSYFQLSSRNDEENNESDSDVEGEHKSHVAAPKMDELLQISLAGKEIFSSTRGHVNNEGLAVFAPMRLTIGVSIITEFLSSGSIEILSRQSYSGIKYDETPFDLFRLMLACLEEKGSLVSKGAQWNKRLLERPVVDESLKDAILSAVGIFRQCKQLDPRNVQYWSWYVAALLGILCIASGTSLSNDSIKRKRRQLPCFSQARAEASRAVDDFIQLTKSEDCPMFYYGVTSMLEWKRAIMLLHRHSSFSTVNRLHANATYRWAVKCCSRVSLSKVQILYDNNKLPLDALLDVLAGLVEQNSCDIVNWTLLVAALGGIGTVAEMNVGECSDGCNALHDGFCINHSRHQERKKGVWWWGTSRASDWESKFFAASGSNVIISRDFKRAILEADTSARWKNVDQSQVITARASNDEAQLTDDPLSCLDFLFDEEEGDNEADIDLSNEHLLPGKQASSNSELTSADWLHLRSKITNNHMRALCLKVIVACHLLGVWHPFIMNSIWWLLEKSRASHQSASETLHLLALHGLDIQAYIGRREWSNSKM